MNLIVRNKIKPHIGQRKELLRVPTCIDFEEALYKCSNALPQFVYTVN